MFFLQELLNEKKAASSVNQAVSALSWHYQTMDLPDPTKSKVVASMVSKAKCLAPPVKHKQLAKKEHMVTNYKYAMKKQTFVAHRLLALALSLLASMSRTDDLIDITRETPFFAKKFIRFDLPRTKTTLYSEGDEKFMASVTGVRWVRPNTYGKLNLSNGFQPNQVVSLLAGLCRAQT